MSIGSWKYQLILLKISHFQIKQILKLVDMVYTKLSNLKQAKSMKIPRKTCACKRSRCLVNIMVRYVIQKTLQKSQVARRYYLSGIVFRL